MRISNIVVSWQAETPAELRLLEGLDEGMWARIDTNGITFAGLFQPRDIAVVQILIELATAQGMRPMAAGEMEALWAAEQVPSFEETR